MTSEMAFRRRTVRRTRRFKPVRRYQSRRRVFKVRRRRRTRGSKFTCIIRRTFTQVLQHDTALTYQIKPTLSDFNEALPFRDNFEAYRVHSVTIRVIPHFNNTTVSTTVPPYYSAPYHQEIDIPSLTPERLLSIDRCKVHNGTASSIRSFVPAVLSDITYPVASGATNTSIAKINWRPRLEIGCKSDKIPLYCGVYYFDKDVNPTATKFNRVYDFIVTCRITFYNQRYLTVKQCG